MADAHPEVRMPPVIDRYLGDTAMLTTEQHGAYFLLLMAMWKAGGVLPDDDGKLANAARLTPARWRSMRDTIRPYFRSDGSGGLVQKRLTIELQRIGQRVEAGKNGAKKRWRKAWQTDSETHGEQHGETGSETGSEPHGETVANPMAEGGSGGSPIPSPPSASTPSVNPQRGLEPNGSIPRRAGEAGSTESLTAGTVCAAMKAAGVIRCNPSSPTLAAMIAQGAELSEFISAAEKAVESGAEKPFAYALKIVESERRRAADVQLAPRTARPGSMADFQQQLAQLKGQA